MFEKKIKNRSLFLSVFIAFFFVAVYCWAGIRIDSPKIRLEILPGGYDGGEIKVENTGERPLSIRVYLEDWVYSEQDGGKEFMPKGTTPLSCSNWITFYPADFKLSPGEEQIVRYTVSVPKEAEGGHYSVMFFETGGGAIEDLDQEGNTIFIKVLHRLGALFYIEARGEVNRTAELKNLNINQRLNDFIVTADFINTGNVDITAGGTLNVLDAQGYVYVRGEFEDLYTLPKDTATLRSSVQSTTLDSGDYDLLLTIEFEGGGTLVKEVDFTVSHSGAITSIVPKD